MPSLMFPQLARLKRPIKPSSPGALLGGKSQIVDHTSYSLKGSSKDVDHAAEVQALQDQG